MPDPVEPLILDLLEWLAPSPRRYADVMETWRTSCPRLTVWEDAVDRGLVARKNAGVVVTARGRKFLVARAQGRSTAVRICDAPPRGTHRVGPAVSLRRREARRSTQGQRGQDFSRYCFFYFFFAFFFFFDFLKPTLPALAS